MDSHKLNDLVGFCLEFQADDLAMIDDQIKTLMVMRQMIPGSSLVMPEWAALPAIPRLRGLQEQLKDDQVVTRSLIENNKAPDAPVLFKPSLSVMVEKTYGRKGKSGNEADKPKKIKPVGRTKEAPADSDERPGNLLTPKDRQLKMAQLIDKNGAMSPGALAESIQCDVVRIYGDYNNCKQWFGKSNEGVVLTPEGRAFFAL